MRRAATLFLGLSGLVMPARSAAAQSDSVARAAGPEYSAGGLYRFLLGREYRTLWTTPIRLPVLDLATAEGGLEPVGKTGGQQTHTLRLRNPEGREFFFRSIDKDPSAALPPDLRGTVAGKVVRDQTSSALPAGPLVVAPLLAAAGVLHDETRLVILPDDSLLGDLRPSFAGIVGTLEQGVGGKAGAHWGGALEVIESDTLLARVSTSPDERVDDRAFLAARLMDVLLGDWDRHRDQWRWARFNEDPPHWWRPVPLDRDQAFVKYDGMLLSIARQAVPQLTNFGPEYPQIIGATWNGRDLDRRYLVGLDWSKWDSVAHAVQAALTDSVIDNAVAALPPPHDSLVGPWLAGALRRRRDRLPQAAERYYRLLAREVDVHATHAGELATVIRDRDGSVTVTIARREPSGSQPHFERRFRQGETHEVRLFLEGGNDSAVVRGEGGGITLRILGEGSGDVLVDSAGSGNDRFYSGPDGSKRTAGLGSRVDRRPWAPPPNPNPRALPPRDWGDRRQWNLWGSFGPDVGLFFGLGRTFTSYGFRKLPFASQHRIRLGFATGPQSYRADYRGEFHRENSGVAGELVLRASGIEVIRFDGFGNDSKAPGADEFYRVTQDQVSVAPSLLVPLGGRVALVLGPTLKYVSTDNRPNRFLASLNPYGVGDFGEVGAQAGLRYDSRNRPTAATRGVKLEAAGTVHPGWWDVRETFGDVSGTAMVFLSAQAPLDPTLALRLGGRKLWGAYPYFEAAFIGDRSTVRLGRDNRFAGDASAYGSAELRLTLFRTSIVVPSDIGVFGLADAGRVWLAGESSDTWHQAFGGGLSLGFLSRANTLSVALAASDERTRVYVQAGFGF
jgi:hypothetical protein